MLQRYFLILVLFFTFLSEAAVAQCPTNANTVFATTDEVCYGAKDGTIDITFNDGQSPYTIALLFDALSTNFYLPGFDFTVTEIAPNHFVLSNVPPGAFLIRINCSDGGFVNVGLPDVDGPTHVHAAPQILSPVAQAATNIGCNEFTSNWDSSADATGYRLDVSTDAAFTGILPAYSDLDVGDVTTYDITGLTEGTDYYYRVRAYRNACPASASSNNIQTATAPLPVVQDLTAPGADQACEGEDYYVAMNGSEAGVNYEIYVDGNPTGIATAGDGNPLNVGPINTLVPGSTYALTIYATTGVGCSLFMNGTVNLTVNPTPPTPVATNDGPKCEGEDVTLSTPDVVGASYLWSGPGGFSSTDRTPVLSNVTAAQSGTYSVQIIMLGCPSLPGTTDVLINPTPNLIITDPAPECAPGTVDLTDPAVTAGSDPGTLSYWTDAAATTPLAIPDAVVASGAYFIQLQSAAGCINIQQVNVTINPTPNLVITDPAPECAPGTVDLTDPAITAGSDPGTLSYWTDAAATTPLASPNAVAATGTYYIQLTSAASCTNIQPVNVTINPQPNLVVTDPAPECAPGTVDLTDPAVTAGSDPGTLSYWMDAAATTPLAGPNAVAASGTYYIQLESAASCPDIQPVNVTINPQPNLVITDPAPECAPGTVNLTDPAVTAGSDPGTLSYWTDAAATTPLASPNAVATSGTYYIQLTDGLGCSSINPVNVTINPAPVLVITNPAPVCAPVTVDLTDPAVTAGSDPGTLSYWIDASATNPLANPGAVAVSGTYYIQLQSAAACANIQPVQVNILPVPPAPVASNDGPKCEGEDIQLSTSELAGASYLWTGPNGFSSNVREPVLSGVNVTDAGNYQVVLDVGGCPSMPGVTTVDVLPQPTAALSGDATVCPGTSTALTVDLTGQAPWILVYSDGTTDFTENINSSPYTINVNPLVTTTYTPVSVSDASCSGSVSGSATINVTPARDVTIKLDSLTGTPGGQVVVPVRVIDFTDLMTMQFTVTWDPALLTYNGVSDINIGNVSAGSFGVDSVGFGFLTFSWKTASLSDTTIQDNTGIFSVGFDVAYSVCTDAAITVDGSHTPIEIADENMCVANVHVEGGNVEIPVSASISGNDPDNIICFGDQIIFTALPGGMPNYKFYLNGSLVQDDAGNVYMNDVLTDQDSVNVVISGGSGCALTAQGVVMTVNQLTITPTVTDISGCGLSDGAISLIVSGGSGDYSYNWIGPSISDQALKDQTNLGRGFYSVTVTDNVSGCALALDIELKEPVNFILSYTKTDVTSTGGNDGSIDLTITNGTGPFDVLWTGPNGYTSIDQDISNLLAGTYTGTVTDNGSGCTDAIVVEITQPVSGLVLNATKTDVTTCGASDGTINLIITGGSGNYSVTWTGPDGFTSNTQNLTGLGGGTYIATVVDNVTSVTAQWTVQINEPDGFVIGVLAKDITYCAGSDGAISLNVTGGSGNFSYLWTGPNGFTSTDQDIGNLEVGSYRVRVSDQVSGCIDSTDAVVGKPAICDEPCALSVQATTNEVSCPGSEDGAAVINIITGGSGDGNYYVSLDTGATWIPFQGGDITDIIDQGPGTYLYIVKDTVTSCMDTTVANVGISTNLIAVINVEDAGCALNDGKISINVGGGVTPYEVKLIHSDGFTDDQSGEGFFQYRDLTEGKYSYEVKEQSGCVIKPTDSIELKTNCSGGCTDLLATAHSFEDATCATTPNGKAVLDVTGGSSPYEYSVDGTNWISFISGNVIDQLPPSGAYNIIVRQDSANAHCRVEVGVVINGPPAIVQDELITTVQVASCNVNDGAVKIGKISGGSVPYGYQLDGTAIALASDSVISELRAGIHTFSVLDDVDCRADFPFIMQSPGAIIADVEEVPASCADINLKSGIRVMVDLVATDITGPYEAVVVPISHSEDSLIYSIPDTGMRTIYGFAKGYYDVTVRSAAGVGCSYFETLGLINGVWPVDFNIVAYDSIISCVGGMGSITIGNVQGFADSTFYVQLVRDDNLILDTWELFYTELENGFTIDENNSDNLVSGSYFIRIIQNQVGCSNITATSELITMNEPNGTLGFEVFESDMSYPDQPTGSVLGHVLPSGGHPYEARIQLIDPFIELSLAEVLAFNEAREWIIVEPGGGDGTVYEVLFEGLWPGKYEITVRDVYGCEVVVEQDVERDTRVFIPNVFTPNHDGYNDEFFVRNLPESGTEVIISNRTGRTVFITKDYNKDNLWDGGEEADGIYFYRILMPDGQAFTGWVELWRGAKP